MNLTVSRSPVTDDELTELERLCAAATPGPWAPAVGPGSPYLYGIGPFYPLGDTEVMDMKPGDADAAFLCAARDAVPRLVAEIRRLRGMLDEASELLWHATQNYQYGRDAGSPLDTRAAYDLMDRIDGSS